MTGENKGNIVRVTTQRSPAVYVRYIMHLLRGDEESPAVDSVSIRGMGKAITSAVNIAEIVKREAAPLYDNVSIASETVEANDKDAEETKERKLSVIRITLSKAPISAEAAAEAAADSGRSESRGGAGKSRGRRGRGSREESA